MHTTVLYQFNKVKLFLFRQLIKMSRQTYYNSNGKTKINIQKHLCGFQGKQVKKHFVAVYAIQNHCNLGIWELKH